MTQGSRRPSPTRGSVRRSRVVSGTGSSDEILATTLAALGKQMTALTVLGKQMAASLEQVGWRLGWAGLGWPGLG